VFVSIENELHFEIFLENRFTVVSEWMSSTYSFRPWRWR